METGFNPYALIEEQRKRYGVDIIKQSPEVTEHKRSKKKDGSYANNKMFGIGSLSTSPFENQYCLSRMENQETVCYHCYATSWVKRYKTLRCKMERNMDLMSRYIVHWDYLPLVSTRFFRFEAFGDLVNEIQFENYLNICLKNPFVHFAIWTKNPFIMEKVFSHRDKPDNLIIVVSSVYKNVVLNGSFSFADKIFTVYEKKYAKEHNIKINCRNSCLECGLCYVKNDVKQINELLK